MLYFIDARFVRGGGDYFFTGTDRDAALKILNDMKAAKVVGGLASFCTKSDAGADDVVCVHMEHVAVFKMFERAP